ncbi:MAG: hypothetical protein IT236_15020 [Bacteroidia bacterium]|nr:hypothetical protein [Bacteroidia bacterium]
MATQTSTYSGSLTTTKHSGYDLLIEKLKPNHFALVSMAILIGSCAGGIGAMYVFMSGAPFWQFILGLGISMANLIACIGQAPTKWVFNFFALSVIINLILVFSHL